jgi:hypothetical protein
MVAVGTLFVVATSHKKYNLCRLQTLKNSKLFFYLEKLETLVSKVVCDENMHIYTKNEIIITKFAMDFAINMVTWVESQGNSYMIAFFVNDFFSNYHMTSLVFFLPTMSHTMTPCASF